MVPRLLAVTFLLVLVAGAAWVGSPHGAPATEGGTFAVTVRDPDGHVFWNGQVAVNASAATPLGTLQAAAQRGGFGLDLEPTAMGVYVRGIGPYEETTSAGWCYFIDAGSGFRWVPEAADGRVLHPGERVLWSWNAAASGAC